VVGKKLNESQSLVWFQKNVRACRQKSSGLDALGTHRAAESGSVSRWSSQAEFESAHKKSLVPKHEADSVGSLNKSAQSQ